MAWDRKNAMQTFTEVPELSLSDFTDGDAAARADFIAALYEGFRYFGFIILRDHGISKDLLDRAYIASADFFTRPMDEKMRYDSGLGGQRGYTKTGREQAVGGKVPDLKEFWHIGQEPAEGSDMRGVYQPNLWPDHPADFKETFLTLYKALEEAGQVMLEALAPSLEVDTEYFRAMTFEGNSILRLLHYPPVPEDADPDAVRAAAHEDINLITILVAASSSGLELLDRNGEWLPVEGSKNALIVDAGDMLARITNNHIPATTHRVVNPDGPNVSRYSMPFFLHPRPEAQLSCLPQFRNGSEMPDITADDFLQQRLEAIGLKK
ncbi:isopenicillin N synthase family oxygenase [Aquisalinus flavus]|nr:isopenicillin N synthase family oxygenase [Aquisalinus flavus]